MIALVLYFFAGIQFSPAGESMDYEEFSSDAARMARFREVASLQGHSENELQALYEKKPRDAAKPQRELRMPAEIGAAVDPLRKMMRTFYRWFTPQRVWTPGFARNAPWWPGPSTAGVFFGACTTVLAIALLSGLIASLERKARR